MDFLQESLLVMKGNCQEDLKLWPQSNKNAAPYSCPFSVVSVDPNRVDNVRLTWNGSMTWMRSCRSSYDLSDLTDEKN